MDPGNLIPTPLRAVKPAVNQGAVEMLEEALALAKAGEIDGVAIASICPKGITRQAYDAGSQSVAELYMSIGHLQAGILNNCHET
tara:strand:- start:137 stop:391 length:255 start_codon:yes stop_codon:yes gene_type:complete